MLGKVKVLLRVKKNNVYFIWWTGTFMIIFPFVILKMWTVSDKICRENKKTS
jgi:hypothetical protein